MDARDARDARGARGARDAWDARDARDTREEGTHETSHRTHGTQDRLIGWEWMGSLPFSYVSYLQNRRCHHSPYLVLTSSFSSSERILVHVRFCYPPIIQLALYFTLYQSHYSFMLSSPSPSLYLTLWLSHSLHFSFLIPYTLHLVK